MPDPVEPERTCVGCRARVPVAQLLRVVARGGVAVPDPRHLLPGRGAHLHRDGACLARAEQRRALPRALRVPGPLDLAALRLEIGEDHSDAASGLPE